MRALLRHFLLLVLVLDIPVALAATPDFPELKGRVVDQADLMDQSSRASVEEALAAHESKTGQQVVVATLKSLDGVSIEEYGYQLGRFWGIGQKGKNNGLLLIVAPHERAVRIEVGYGLEGTMTDAISHLIINRIILPRFKEGDYPRGIVQGTAAILSVLEGSDVAIAGQAAPSTVKMQQEEGWGQVLFPLFFIFLIFFLIPMLSRRGRNGIIPLIISSGSHGGFYNGGGFSGGGFSGGGGSFGGGGASGRW